MREKETMVVAATSFSPTSNILEAVIHGGRHMPRISDKHSQELAKEKIEHNDAYGFGKAKGYIEEGGRFVTIPPTKAPAKSIEEYEAGANIGLLLIDHAQRDGIKKGAYEIRIFKNHGNWIIHLMQNNKPVYETTSVHFEEMADGPESPLVALSGFSPVFWFYFIAGFLIILALRACSECA